MSLAVCHACDRVLKKSDVKRCGRCKIACYCSTECQSQDWKTGRSVPHKITCQKGMESLTDEAEKLINSDITVQECIVKISERSPQTPALTLVIKNRLMKNADPNDSFEIEDAQAVKPPPGHPPKPSKLAMGLMKLGMDITPANSTLEWLVNPGFLNVLLHDPIVDANQAYLAMKQKEVELGVTTTATPKEEQLKALAPLRATMARDSAAPLYGLFVLNCLCKIAMGVPPNSPYFRQGQSAMKRLIWLASDETTRNLLANALMQPLQMIMKSAKPQFLQAGGLVSVIKMFSHTKVRLISLMFLAQVNLADWVKFGDKEAMLAVWETLLLPGLVTDELDNFQYIFGDLPEVTLGQPRKNGGSSRSTQANLGSCSAGHGFAPFGKNLLKTLVKADAIVRSRQGSSKELSGFLQALVTLTEEGEARSQAVLFYLREVIGFPAAVREETSSAEDKETETVVAEVPKVDFTEEQVLGAIQDWRGMSWAERKPYYWRAYDHKERLVMTQAGEFKG